MHKLLLLLLSVTPAALAEDSPPKPAEDWAYIQNSDIKVGLLRSHSGAIGYLSAADSDSNVFNHFDHGRLVQQSYYGEADGSLWGEKPWAYNPVQGGDYKGHAAKLVDFKTTDTTAYAKTIPRHWASGELLDDCTMEQWVELDGPIVRVRFQFHYGGAKTHAARHQEVPAVFVSPRLKNLVTYSGEKPWTGGAVTSRQPGWPNESAVLSENWAAYVDDRQQGVGVYVPDTTEATCYRYQGGSGSDCSYIAPVRRFALTPDLTFSYTAYFTLGDVDTIRERFAKLSEAER